MKNIKQILFLLIALSSLSLALSSSDSKKLEKAFNNITENTNTKSSYQVLNEILEKRNKELKDLRLQSDYVVTPEYNEWQIFFSGFYNHSNRNSHSKTAKNVLNEENSIKTINLGKVITVRNVEDITVNAPEINFEKKYVTKAPEINIPEIEMPQFNILKPNLNINPNILHQNVDVNTNIYVPVVGLSPITVVSFSLPSENISARYTNRNGGTGIANEIKASDGENAGFLLTPGAKVNEINNLGELTISKKNSMGMVATEASLDNLHIINRSNIVLNESLTIGMEGRGSKKIPFGYLLTNVTNEGDIIGNSGFKNQAGLSIGLNNSITGSRVTLSNNGNITMNSPESIGIQLRPDTNPIIAQGINNGTITVNGYRSYGMMTTPGGGNEFLNQDPTMTNGTSRLALSTTGVINVNGDESTGFAILVGINEWGGNGTINVGTVNPNQDGNGNLHSSTSLVERATGLYSNQPTVTVTCPISVNPSGLCGLAEITGTGNINIGSFSYQSSGVRVEGQGVIGNTGTININGDHNYGAVILGTGHFDNHIWTPSGNSTDGKIFVNSNNSIGIFVNEKGKAYNQSLVRINGVNSPAVLVNNGDINNLGYSNNPVHYGRGDGLIETTGANSHGVILTRGDLNLTSQLTNTGTIRNNSEGTVGVYAEKGSIVHHFFESATDTLAQTAKISAGNGATGVYAKDLGTVAYLSAPIQVGSSTPTNTAIAVMTDGNAQIIFTNNAGTQEQASLSIGNNAIALYSIDGTKFSSTFRINSLKASMGDNSVFGYIKEGSAKISDLANVSFTSIGNNSAILYGANNSDITIDTNLNIPANINLVVAENSKVTLNPNISINGFNTGLSAFALENKFLTNGTTALNNTKTGVLNQGTINMSNPNSIGTYVLYGKNTNDTTGIINIHGNKGLGMFSEEEADIQNKGIINLNSDNAIGIYAKGDSGKNYSSLDNINISNTGTINLNNTGNTGIAVNNNKIGSSITDSVINNTGNINIQGTDSIGVYSIKSTVNNTGNINLTGNNTIGIYGEQGTEVTNSGIIDLGTSNQLQTAYYLTDNSKITSLGDIKGYGIAVYGKDTTIDDTFATLDLTGTSDQGKGKIGLVLSGNSVFNYTKEIKVGDSVGNNYSVALYTDNQNLSIANFLFAGANGVGLYTQNGSNVNYAGTINVGDSATAGTGLYIGTTGTNTSTVSLDGTINLNGNGGIGAYVDKGSTFNFNSAGTMNFYGHGVAVYGNNGAVINDNGGTINTNGFMVERLRVKNGTINIINDNTMVSNTILGHVINGEINVSSGVTVTATGNDIIGIYADGIKGAGTWLYHHEANNLGTLDFTNALNSTAMYIDNGASGNNLGTIKVGTDSVGMYGDNNSTSYNNSNIESGLNSVGIFTNSSKAYNNGNIVAESVGIYGENLSDINNNGTLVADKNYSIGMYGDNSNINNNSVINVTKENSIGIYGDNLSIAQNNQDINISGVIDISKANIGIYNTNSNSINNGNILGGENSIGIYNKGNFDNFGNITLNTGSIGVYTDGGTATIHAGSKVEAGEVALLIKNGTIINNSTDLKANFLGYAGTNGKLLNNANINVEETGFYANSGEIENNGIITANNDEVIFFYTDNGKITNNSDITGSGIGNIGIYGKDSVIQNIGNIIVADSQINSKTNSKLNKYSIGIFGQNSNINNTGKIEIGENAIGIYAGNNSSVINTGNIEAHKNDSVGIFLDRSSATNSGVITMNGDNSIGIYLQENSSLVNTGTININGKDSKGIYMYDNHSTLINNGTINLNGDNSIGIVTPENVSYTPGIINANGTGTSSTGNSSIKFYEKPTIVNAGQINVAGNFDTTGLDIIIKTDPNNISQIVNKTGDTVSLIANSINVAGNLTGNGTVHIAPDFTEGTNFETYILEDVINTKSISGIDSGEIKLGSKSVTWEAVPVKNADGTTDIYMKKIAYDKLSKNLWFNDFSKALDSKYLGSKGDRLTLFDKIDKIESESDFRHVFGTLGGNIYANMNQREKDIAGVFENSLDLLQDSKNNTKENVKINVIVGKGRTKGDSAGVIDYDYTTAGVMALREVERTYKHKFGYSLGYTHTNFEFNDDNDSEELADTFQLGFHNKYRLNNDYLIKTDVTGRISLYNIDRNVDWKDGNKKSELNGHYETYSITVDNKVQREFELDENNKIVPYAGLKLGYLNRPGFNEKGFESLKVKGTQDWEVKPEIGVSYKTSTNELNNAGLKLKGMFDVSYGYELVDNNSERAKLKLVEDSYHKLATPNDTNGILKTKAIIGAEIEDKYGIFFTGEYLTGNSSKNDYKLGISLKAVF